MVKVKPKKKNIFERLLYNKAFDKAQKIQSTWIDMREDNRRKRLGGRSLTEVVKELFKRKKDRNAED